MSGTSDLGRALAGDGHFTTLVLDSGRTRGWQLHEQRLCRDHAAYFGATLDTAPIVAALRELSTPEPIVVRITVLSDGFLLTTRPVPPPEPLTLETFPLVRPLARIKHCALAPLWHARRAVSADDALLVDPSGRILEATMANIGFLDEDGTLVWPRGENLPGTAQQLLGEAVAPSGGTAGVGSEAGFGGEVRAEGQTGTSGTAGFGGGALRVRRVEHREVTVADLDRFLGAFVTNAVTGVREVTAINDWRPSPEAHALIEQLAQRYAALPQQTVGD